MIIIQEFASPVTIIFIKFTKTGADKNDRSTMPFLTYLLEISVTL